MLMDTGHLSFTGWKCRVYSSESAWFSTSVRGDSEVVVIWLISLILFLFYFKIFTLLIFLNFFLTYLMVLKVPQ